MTRAEFLAWIDFYRLYPFDDMHRIHRPAALIASGFGGGSIEDRLDWLHPQPAPEHDYNAADLNTLKAFGFSSPKG